MLPFGFQSPNRFEEVFEEMISFLEHTEHWENTEVELATRGVRGPRWQIIKLLFKIRSVNLTLLLSPGEALELL